MDARLRQALQRAEEIERALADPAVARDPAKLKALGREHTRLAPIVRLADKVSRLQKELAQARELSDEPDVELAALARADVAGLAPEIEAISSELREMLIPRDPHDDRDAIMEIRAGTGGDEAALFAADLYRMYQRFSERHGLRWEPISLSDGTLGGRQGSHRRRSRRRCLRPPATGIRGAPGAARAGHRNTGAHSHLRRHGGGVAGGGRGGCGHLSERPQDRRVSLFGSRRARA